MLSESVLRVYGKGVGTALLALLLCTVVMLVVLLLVANGNLEGEPILGTALMAYYGSMGVIAGTIGGMNIAERLPGERKWQNPHQYDGQQRRQTDRPPPPREDLP